MTLFDMVTCQRDIAFDEARAVIWRARYGEQDLTDLEMAHEVFVARVQQWNAAAIFRWKLRQLARPIVGVVMVA